MIAIKRIKTLKAEVETMIEEKKALSLENATFAS